MQAIFAKSALERLRARLTAAVTNALARTLFVIGLALVMVGALIGLSALIGPALAFGLSGAALACAAGFYMAAISHRVPAQPPQNHAPRRAPAPPPQKTAALEAAFALGFVVMRALATQRSSRR